jgi:hypothetical protein
MITKIYLDMDGVLCDFEKRYKKLFNESPEHTRRNKDWSENWTTFIETEQFKTLEWFPGGKTLLETVLDTGIDVEILSSSGGKKYHSQVESHKKFWLMNNGISFKSNIVPGSAIKAKYANSSVVLIDDTDYVIEAFNKAGGYGILHKDVKDTVKKLNHILHVAK